MTSTKKYWEWKFWLHFLKGLTCDENQHHDEKAQFNLSALLTHYLIHTFFDANNGYIKKIFLGDQKELIIIQS